MTIITDSDLHDSLCQICIESPHSLLSELGYAAKQKIIETTVCISYKKGDLIYQEGDMPTGLHCLLTGKAKIYKEGIGGRQQIVRMAKPIGFIGYRAFFAEEIHIASAEALEDSIVCRIKTELILDIVRTTPDLAMSIIRIKGNLWLRSRWLYVKNLSHPGRSGQLVQHDHGQCYPYPF